MFEIWKWAFFATDNHININENTPQPLPMELLCRQEMTKSGCGKGCQQKESVVLWPAVTQWVLLVCFDQLSSATYRWWQLIGGGKHCCGSCCLQFQMFSKLRDCAAKLIRPSYCAFCLECQGLCGREGHDTKCKTRRTHFVTGGHKPTDSSCLHPIPQPLFVISCLHCWFHWQYLHGLHGLWIHGLHSLRIHGMIQDEWAQWEGLINFAVQTLSFENIWNCKWQPHQHLPPHQLLPPPTSGQR